MHTAILTLHVIVCLVLVVLVLLQAGREGMGVIFGGGGNASVFGSAGAGGILVKLTAFLAVLFLFTSLGYNLITSSGREKTSSILDVQFEEVLPAETTPAVPATETPEQPAVSGNADAASAPAVTEPSGEHSQDAAADEHASEPAATIEPAETGAHPSAEEAVPSPGADQSDTAS